MGSEVGGSNLRSKCMNKRLLQAITIPGIIFLFWLMTGCTEQQRAKQFGGSTKIEVPANKKFVNITWKSGGDIWVVTRDRELSDTKQVFYFTESSSWGLLEGSIVIIEK